MDIASPVYLFSGYDPALYSCDEVWNLLTSKLTTIAKI